ncbi:hypothetical protein PP657_gp095 [Bacillus phage BCPST]|uniref:Uncharacterized protein n=1 Tax=Bacillus phage BCPST TaxID=2801506 RepID=A0AAE7TQE1_9CAUD|nr:hypothetical protein PP657_gp095 [Bacillus phage BCPST]QQO38727.1 hypothetical protein BCPST_109 [Bacillus phage BCPST]QSJ04313.1 hypothetical protein BCP6_109 [Bacillus phage BCP6]
MSFNKIDDCKYCGSSVVLCPDGIPTCRFCERRQGDIECEYCLEKINDPDELNYDKKLCNEHLEMAIGEDK